MEDNPQNRKIKTLLVLICLSYNYLYFWNLKMRFLIEILNDLKIDFDLMYNTSKI